MTYKCYNTNKYLQYIVTNTFKSPKKKEMRRILLNKVNMNEHLIPNHVGFSCSDLTSR